MEIPTVLHPLFVVLAAILRSFLGWLKISLKDGFIQDYEFRKLGETVVRVGLIGIVIAYFPGIDVSWFEVGIIALGGDLLLNAVKKLKPAAQ